VIAESEPDCHGVFRDRCERVAHGFGPRPATHVERPKRDNIGARHLTARVKELKIRLGTHLGWGTASKDFADGKRVEPDDDFFNNGQAVDIGDLHYTQPVRVKPATRGDALGLANHEPIGAFRCVDLARRKGSRARGDLRGVVDVFIRPGSQAAGLGSRVDERPNGVGTRRAWRKAGRACNGDRDQGDRRPQCCNQRSSSGHAMVSFYARVCVQPVMFVLRGLHLPAIAARQPTPSSISVVGSGVAMDMAKFS